MPRRRRRPLSVRIATAFALLATPLLASAVSLGEIRLQSHLNEPFRAEIPVTALEPGDMELLQAQLGSEEAFQRFGLERGRFLISLDFSLQPGRSADTAKIVVSSPEIAREPFFTFLVELKGQRERLIREYTVLLDPNVGQPPPTVATKPLATAPYIEEEPAEQAEAPAVQVPQPEAYESTTPIVESTDPVVTPRAKPQVSEVIYENQPVLREGEYGPVRAGETLWGIAAAVQPSDRVTMNQVMWALFSHNESQFDGSIDRLHKGAMLTVPSEQAMRDVSPAEANALVASASGPRVATPQQLEVEEAPKTARATPAPAPTPQPYYEEDLAEEEPALPEEPAVAPPEEDLSLVEPEEDAELEALPEEPVAEDEGYEELPALPEDEMAAGDEEELPADVEEEFAEEGLPQEPEQAQAPPPLPQPEPESDSPLLTWLLAGLALIGLAGAGAYFLNRSKREKPSAEPVSPAARAAPAAPAAPAAAAASTAVEDTQDVTEDAEELDTQEFEAPPPSAKPEPEPEPQYEEDLDATAQFEAPLGEAPSGEDRAMADELAELDLPESEEIDEAEGTLDLGSETVSLELNEDPLSEADFQLAYGLYDEAALLLQRAIESTPDRIELYEKLAETHFAASNADEFKATAEKLKARGPGEDVWQRIAIMGQQLCPDDSLFTDDEGGGGAVDLDMGFDEPDEGGDNSIEFDMGEEQPTKSAAPAHEDSTVFEADFDDLDLDESDEPADDTLAELDDLGLDDLESELDTGSDEGAEPAAELDEDEFSLTLDEPEDDTTALSLEDINTGGASTDFDLDEAASGDEAELTLQSGDEFSLEEEPASQPEESSPAEEELSLVGEETDFGVDTGEGAEDSLDLSDLPEDTDFDVDSGEQTGVQEEPGLTTDFELPEDETESESTDFDLSEVADLTTSELELDAGPVAAEMTDFDLSDEGATGEGTDFDLDDASTTGEESDFELSELGGEDTDFDLGSEDAGESTDFDLGDMGSETDFDLGDSGEGTELDDLSLADIDSDDTSLDMDDATSGLDLGDSGAADISGGDEPGTKLDLATAYVEMGEADMARSLLNEVLQAGDDEQKAKARELLDRL